MKKLIIVLISVILLLALTSCDFNSVFDEIVEEKPDATELFLSGDKGYSEYSGVYLTFDGDTVKYEERAVLTSSWESTYVIKGGQIMFEGSVGYTTVLTRGTWYSFSKLDNTITIDGKEFTLQEVETSAE